MFTYRCVSMASQQHCRHIDCIKGEKKNYPGTQLVLKALFLLQPALAAGCAVGTLELLC